MPDGPKFRIQAIEPILNVVSDTSGRGIVVPRGMKGNCLGVTRAEDGRLRLFIEWDHAAVFPDGAVEADEIGAVISGWEMPDVDPALVEVIP